MLLNELEDDQKSVATMLQSERGCGVSTHTSRVQVNASHADTWI